MYFTSPAGKLGNGFICLFICVVTLLPVQGKAQSVSDKLQQQTERLQEREAERMREREQVFRDTQIAPPSNLDTPVDEAIKSSPATCVKIYEAKLSGNSHYKRGIFENNVNSLIGNCTPVAAIDDVLRLITNRYVSDGYITSRAIVSPKSNVDGLLNIAVIEGQLDDIKENTTAQKSLYGNALNFVFPNMKQRILNVRDIEQGVDQLARLGGSEPQIDIVPGAKSGTSELIVRRLRSSSWIRPSITINNDGSNATGRQQMTATLDIDSPLGLADFWSIYFVRDLDRPFSKGSIRGSEGYGGFVSLPYGYTTLFISGGRFRYKSVFEANGLTFPNTGDSINGSIGLDHLIFRNQKTKITLSGSLSFYDTTNRIQGIRLSTNSYRLVTGGISAKIQHRIKNALLLAEFEASRGFDALGANAANINDSSDGLIFRKLEGRLSYQSNIKMLGVLADYSATLRGQAALDLVLPAERFSIGGSSTVRGFQDDGLSGLAGFAFRQQFNIGLLKIFGNSTKINYTRLSMILGYDAGGILPRKNDAFERGFLHSSILGLRLSNRRVYSEVAIEAPLSAPSNVLRSRFKLAASVRITI